jgi:predicted secreted protein
MKKLLLLAAFAAVYAPVAAQGQDTNQVRADESSNNRTITLRRGQYLQVSVQACVGCGYGWRLMRLPTNLSLSSMEDIDATDRRGPEPVVGGAKTIVYTFLVESPGRGALQLENRPFQGPRARDGSMLRLNVVTR